MKQQLDEAFVLRTQELGDSDVIVTLFAASCGKVRGVARSARASRRRFGGLLEPMTHVRARWVEKSGRDLDRIERLEGVRSHADMQADPACQAACAVLAELAEAFLIEGQSDPPTFRLLGAVLDALEAGLHPWLAVRYFELWTLRLHGLMPELDRCHRCGQLLPPERARWVERGTGVRCTGCGAGEPGLAHRLGDTERALLATMIRQGPRHLVGIDATPARPGGAVEHLLRGQLEAFAERRFRTYRHLRVATEGP